MHFKGDPLYAVSVAECGLFLPIGDQHLVPLPLKNFLIIVGPGTGDPVGVFGFGAVAGTARKSNQGLYAQLLGQQNGVVKIAFKTPCNRLVRMQRIAVAGKRRQIHMVFRKHLLQFFNLFGMSQKVRSVAVCLSGVTAAPQLQTLHAKG